LREPLAVVDSVAKSYATESGVVAARDAGRAYRLACETEEIRHESLFIVADDIRSPLPTLDLLRRHFPGVEMRAQIEEFGAVISGARARAALGFEPRHRWRDDLPPAELADAPRDS